MRVEREREREKVGRGLKEEKKERRMEVEELG